VREAQAGIRVAVAWGYVSHTSASPVVESRHCLGGKVLWVGEEVDSTAAVCIGQVGRVTAGDRQGKVATLQAA
jgi:hypothetical protein